MVVYITRECLIGCRVNQYWPSTTQRGMEWWGMGGAGGNEDRFCQSILPTFIISKLLYLRVGSQFLELHSEKENSIKDILLLCYDVPHTHLFTFFICFPKKQS